LKRCTAEEFLACVILRLGFETGYLTTPSVLELRNLVRFFYDLKLRLAKLVFETLGYCPWIISSDLREGWYQWPMGPYNKKVWSYMQKLCCQDVFRKRIEDWLKRKEN